MNLSDEMWLRAVAEAEEDAVSTASGVSVTEAERVLTVTGFDTKQERARALEIIASLTGERAAADEAAAGASHETAAANRSGVFTNGAVKRVNGTKAPAREAGDAAIESAAWESGPPAAVRPRRASRSRVYLALSAALVAAAATGGILYAVGHRSKAPDPPVDPPREVPSAPTPSVTASASPPALSPPVLYGKAADSLVKHAKEPGYSTSGKPVPAKGY
jgi:hypothetical protein